MMGPRRLTPAPSWVEMMGSARPSWRQHVGIHAHGARGGGLHAPNGCRVTTDRRWASGAEGRCVKAAVATLAHDLTPAAMLMLETLESR